MEENLLPVTVFYVNKKNRLEGILKTNVELTVKDELLKDNMVKLIGTYNHYKHKSYVILDVLKYHVALNSIQQCNSLMKKEDWMNTFVSTGWKYSNDMAWENTMKPLNQLNSLNLLFIEKQQSTANKSKRNVKGQMQSKKTKRVQQKF